MLSFEIRAATAEDFLCLKNNLRSTAQQQLRHTIMHKVHTSNSTKPDR
jgi:hypothetical protein